jgi:hypothetical protein
MPLQHHTLNTNDLLRKIEKLTKRIQEIEDCFFSNDGSIHIGDGHGDAEIVMKKDGSITIRGKDFLFEGSGNVKIKAANNLELKGAKIVEN